MAKEYIFDYDDWADYAWAPDEKKRIFPIPLNWPAGGVGEDNPLQKLIDDMKEVDDEAIEMSDKEEDDYIYEELEEDDDEKLKPVLEEIELDGDFDEFLEWMFEGADEEEDGEIEEELSYLGIDKILDDGLDEGGDADEEELSSVELKTIRDEDDLAKDREIEEKLVDAFECVMCEVIIPMEGGEIPSDFSDWFCEECQSSIWGIGEDEEES